MADWTTIPDSSIEPGKPIRSIDGLALRDNPIAIAEGAPGAPRIVGEGIAQYNELPALTVTAADTRNAQAGNLYQELAFATTGTTEAVAARYIIGGYSGSIRFRASHYGSSGNLASILSIYKNNILIQSYTNSSGADVQRTIDVYIVPGDVIEWRHRCYSGSWTVTVSNVYATASNAWYATTAFRRYA